MVKPSASSEYIAPRLTPLITCWSSTSHWLIASSLDAAPRAGSSRLRRWFEILQLVRDVVQGVFVIVTVLEDADRAVENVAILVESHRSLQRVDMRTLDRVADVRAVHFLAAFRHCRDGSDDDLRRIIRGNRIIVRGRVIFLLEGLHEIGRHRAFRQVGTGI